MTAFCVQVVVFCFAGLIFSTGICVALRRDANKTAIITLFTAGVLTLILAAINLYEIIEIAYSKKGDFKIKRYQPSSEERKEILKVAKDKPEKITPERKNKIIKAATIREDEKKSAEDYLVLATEAWRAKEFDDALKLSFVGLN